MRSAVAPIRRYLPLGVLCGALVVVGCSRGSDDILDDIRKLHARDRYEESLEGLRELMDEDPTDPEVNFLLGKTLMYTGEPSMAIWPLRRAVKSPEHAFDAGMMLALATIDSRTPQDAIEAVDAALAVDPDNVEALSLRGLANLKSGRYADALNDIERAVELDPNDPATLVPRVLVLLEFNRAAEAEAVLEASEQMLKPGEELALEKTQARLCLTNAAYAFDKGDLKSAEVMFADCLDAYPADPLVVLTAVEFYDTIDEQERSTELLRRTFEETRSTEFGRALLRRTRRLNNQNRLDSLRSSMREKPWHGPDPGRERAVTAHHAPIGSNG